MLIVSPFQHSVVVGWRQVGGAACCRVASAMRLSKMVRLSPSPAIAAKIARKIDFTFLHTTGTNSSHHSALPSRFLHRCNCVDVINFNHKRKGNRRQHCYNTNSDCGAWAIFSAIRLAISHQIIQLPWNCHSFKRFHPCAWEDWRPSLVMVVKGRHAHRKLTPYDLETWNSGFSHYRPTTKKLSITKFSNDFLIPRF